MIFVFGSNLAGAHGAGAALTARRYYGAVLGVGEGLTGRSYALPTKDGNIQPMAVSTIQTHVDRFIDYARLFQNFSFKVTRVGCGLGGHVDEDIAPLFLDAPKENCFFDLKWRPIFESHGKDFEYWGSF